jgi:hypothetical protein
MPFALMMRDNVELLKANGTTVPGLKASVHAKGINMFPNPAAKLVVETGDLIRRRLSTGAEELYRVIDPGFHEAFRGIPANYQMKVRRLDPADAASAIASLGGEEISEERRVRLFAQWEEHGVDFIKHDLLNGGCAIVGGPPSNRKLAREWVRIKEAEQKQAAGHVITVSGPNSRVNIDSTDQSTNAVVGGDIFNEINRALVAGVQNDSARALLETQINRMEAAIDARDRKSFTASYQTFIGLAADYMTILTPFLPALTDLFKNLPS